MYTFEKKDKQGVLKVQISKEEWEKAVEESYQKNKGRFKVQGFRAGKAPRRVIEQNYGDTVFFDDAFDAAISEAYSKFLSENKQIVPIGHPHVEMNSFTMDKGVEATLKFDLMPEFVLPDLSTLSTTKKEAVVADEEIERELENARQTRAKFVEEDKTAENGDFATIDFVGYVDDEKFEGGEAQDYRLELGSHTFIDGFEDQIVGLKKGEEKDINVTFPENYPAENLAGKPAVFKITVKKIEKKILPEINDQFVSDSTEFETVADYKASIKEHLLKHADERAERDFEVAILDEIADKCGIELSQEMIDHEVKHMVEDFEHRLSHQGMTMEGYLQYLGKTLEEFKKEREEDAGKNIRTRLVLQRIISDYKLGVKAEELEAKIAEYAANYNMSAEDLKKNMSQNDYVFFQNEVIMTKVFDLLKSKRK